MGLFVQRSSVLGIGDLLWDTTVKSNVSLEEMKLSKGNSQKAHDRETVEKGLRKAFDVCQEWAESPGGSASNALKVIARLGNHHVRLCALVADDDIGRKATQRLKEHGIELLNVESNEVTADDKTARLTSFITEEDGTVERTMHVFHDIALKYTADCVKEEYFKYNEMTERNDKIVESNKTFQYVFNDGYNIYQKGMLQVSKDIAKKLGCKTILGLPCASAVKNYVNGMVYYANNVDYCFGNKEEFTALTGAEDPVDIMGYFDADATICMTDGPNGCYVKWAGHRAVRHVKAIDVPNVKDTTGAGDFFAGGVIAGVMAGLPEEDCIRIGNLAASKVIQHLGADLPDDKWDELKNEVQGIFNARFPIVLPQTKTLALMDT